MKEIDIYTSNRAPSVGWLRPGCRGILIKDGKVLLSWEKKYDFYVFPGGGLEQNEGLADCCAREIAEETGYLTSLRPAGIQVREYWESALLVFDYFTGDVTGTTERHLTEAEEDHNLVPVWVPVDEALQLFGAYESYFETDGGRAITYWREYEALKAFLSEQN